ncbi:hypothetical protein [Hymenobacter sp. ISL-91]|uniref:hypothetical protein n=1 Tax=Hymenobacter sp. ISL-91 TaxID=2819151 RepID=UPI001BE75219|nr:hypothetical protein [Hymenobacter sp. ISL-91]
MLLHTTGLKVQGLIEDQPKYTKQQALREAHPQLFGLLDASPLFAYSPTGLQNIIRRFGVSTDTLEQCLAVYLRPGESPSRDEHMAQDVARLLTATPELLDTIAKVVGPKARTRKKAAAKGQKGGKYRGK